MASESADVTAPQFDQVTLDFLSEGTKTGHLGYVAKDGRPLVAPIWFVVDDGRIAFTTFAESAKGRALRRDRRVVLTVDLQTPPYAFVQIQGMVDYSEAVEDARRVAGGCGRRYMGADREKEFADRNGVAGELAVWINPTKIIANLNVTAYG